MNAFLKPSYPRATLLAVVLHLVLLLFLIWQVKHAPLQQLSVQPDVDIIQAVAVSPNQLAIAQAEREKAQQARLAQERQRQQAIAQQKAQAEALRQQKLAAQQAQEKAAQAAKLAAQQAAERLAAAQKAAEQKQAQEKAAAAEAAKSTAAAPPTPTKPTQASADPKKPSHPPQDSSAQSAKPTNPNKTTDKPTVDPQQKAAQQLKIAQQKALDAEMAAEQQALQAAKSAQQQSEIAKYKALIEHAISQNWLVPGGSNVDLTCELLIQVSVDGTVLDVQVSRSSGDAGLDNSARTAVFKASPLPMPADAELAKQFREMRLTVSPKDIQ